MAFSAVLVAACVLLCCISATEARPLSSGNEVQAPYFTYTMKVYAHLSLGGSNPSEVYVAPERQSTGFGSVLVADDLLTSGVSATSSAVGRVKGIGANTDSATGILNSSLYLTFFINYLGKSGTVIVIGTSIRTDTSRVFSIVGGTGDFILSQGQALQQTLSTVLNPDQSISMTNQWTLTFYYSLLSPHLANLASSGLGTLEKIPVASAIATVV